MRDITTASENWASAAHNGLVHNGHPTREHLIDVVSTLVEFDRGSDGYQTYEDTIAAAWLHDALKYTNTTSTEIARTLGKRVSRIVELTTDPGARGLKGVATNETRAQIKQAAYAVFLAEKDPSIREEAGFIRSVDRYCNQRSAIAQGAIVMMEMYLAETPEFLRVYGTTLLGSDHKKHRVHLWDALIAQHADMTLALQAAMEATPAPMTV